MCSCSWEACLRRGKRRHEEMSRSSADPEEKGDDHEPSHPGLFHSLLDTDPDVDSVDQASLGPDLFVR